MTMEHGHLIMVDLHRKIVIFPSFFVCLPEGSLPITLPIQQPRPRGL